MKKRRHRTVRRSRMENCKDIQEGGEEETGGGEEGKQEGRSLLVG